MKEEYEKYFFKYIYELLNLKTIEMKLLNEGITPIIKDDFSHFFWIENTADMSFLTFAQKNDFQMYISNLNDNNKESLNHFFEDTYKSVLLSKSDSVYGPSINRYSAPPNSIVLGFYYQKFDSKDDTVEKIISKEMYINTLLNNIQTKAKESFGLNVSIMKYDSVINGKKMVRQLKRDNN